MADEQRGRIRVEDGPKRVRAYLGGELVVDTRQPKLVWEIPYYPAYYLPLDHVRTELLSPSERVERSPSRGEAHYFTIKAGGEERIDGAWQHPESPIEAIRDHLRIEWSAMDHWFEEDEEVIVHPRDPYSRVDILRSSRHVQVEVDGVVVADSHHPTLLFETGLPTRYYLPLTDVRMELLRPSSTSTQCPYKGTASYWSLEVDGKRYDDYVWTYPAPLPESQKVIGLACFYNEKVDLIVDGERLERPRTPFS
jgi:uncharacterized protein (DUF427 family)